jgi:hypothetical protein
MMIAGTLEKESGVAFSTPDFVKFDRFRFSPDHGGCPQGTDLRFYFLNRRFRIPKSGTKASERGMMLVTSGMIAAPVIVIWPPL